MRDDPQRRPGDKQDQGQGQRQGQGGPSRKDDPGRRPWIEVHGAEMDTNSDHFLSREEVEAEALKAFSGYDTEGDGRIPLDELAQGKPVRSAMGGFIREHAQELDRDQNGHITQAEVTANALRMFDKNDADGDKRIPVGKDNADGKTAAPQNRKPNVEKNNEAGGRTPAGKDNADGKSNGKTPAPQNRKPNADAKSSIPPKVQAGESRPPNIIFVLMDDMGWRDAGFTGNTFVETPHLDRLAREGVQFSAAYAAAPNCAPTRACLLSGQYTPRHGVFTVVDPRYDPGQPSQKVLPATSRDALSGDVVTIAEVLKTRGYATACFGMWNLGRGRSGPSTPTGQGFDIYKNPKDLGFAQNAYFDGEKRYLVDILTDESLRFIEDHRNEPFFLYLPPHDVHSPLEPKPALLEKYRQKAALLGDRNADPAYAATIDAVDVNIGRIRKKLTDLNLEKNTLIVFTSDNGGTAQYVAPLNGGKGALYEGGIRVPCFVWGAGVEKPGRVSTVPVLSIDFFPTLAELAGATTPQSQPVDGVSLVPILKGTGSLSRKAVFWHFPCYIGRGAPSSAMRAGDWKLIEKFEDQSFELYNLHDDPGERRNLAMVQPAKARELKTVLRQWQTETNAPRPTKPNPAFDPSTVRNERGNKKRAMP